MEMEHKIAELVRKTTLLQGGMDARESLKSYYQERNRIDMVSGMDNCLKEARFGLEVLCNQNVENVDLSPEVEVSLEEVLKNLSILEKDPSLDIFLFEQVKSLGSLTKTVMHKLSMGFDVAPMKCPSDEQEKLVIGFESGGPVDDKQKLCIESESVGAGDEKKNECFAIGHYVLEIVCKVLKDESLLV